MITRSHTDSSTLVRYPLPDGRRMINHLVGAAVFLATFSLFLLAYQLEPDAHGMGTHEQLGLPACGFLANTGYPCGTCGYTTTLSLMTHGRFIEGFKTQPAAATFTVLLALVSTVAGWCMLRGASMVPLARTLFQPKVGLTLGALAIAGWIYKIIIVRTLG